MEREGPVQPAAAVAAAGRVANAADNIPPVPDAVPSNMDLTSFCGQRDPRRMLLTPQERAWALQIRDTMDGFPELDTLSDFLAAQFALTNSSTTDIYDKAFGLQAFRQEYDIQSTPEEGCRLVADLIQLFPELYLSFSYSERDDRYVLVYDLTKHDSKVLRDPHNFNTWIRAGYYMAIAMNPDLACSRNGVIQVVECDGYKISKNLDMTYYRKMHEELLNHYPQKQHLSKFFNTGLFVNSVISMVKRFIPKSWTSSFEVGCQMGNNARLNTLWHVPTVEAANAKVVARLQDNICQHYANVNIFELDTMEFVAVAAPET